MDRNLTNLLISEFKTSTTYLDRILHAIMYFTNIWQKREYISLASEIYFDINELLESKLLQESFSGGADIPVSSKDLPDYINRSNSLVEMVLKLDFKRTHTKNFTVEYINLIYDFSHKLHCICIKNADVTIDYPRVNLAKIEKNITKSNHLNLVKESNSPHKFVLDQEAFTQFEKNSGGNILSLDWQRDKKYELFLREGHQAIFEKNFVDALNKFQKALNYKETAEALNLIGWCYHLQGDNESAKKYCLKSINKDQDYGPPYNDLGNYLLFEGNVEDSLKWFELAKKATNYQNKEYPYVNSGRAYMNQKNFDKALEEFSKALTLAPFNEELHDTVIKLKEQVEKSKRNFKTNDL